MDKLLSQFLAVAEAGSLSRAAEALRISQPTLTVNMKRLEDTFGVALLDRTSRGVVLTRYGETVYENARLMRRLYDNTLASIARQRRNSERGISLGTGYTWWTLFVRDLVFERAKRFPNAPIQVSLGHQLRLMDQLLSGDIALFLGHEIEGFGIESGAEFVPLTRLEQAYFVRLGHPLLGAAHSQAEIEAYPQITSSPPETRHQRFFDTLHRRGRVDAVFDRVDFAFGSNSMAACVDFALATDGVLVHSDLMAPEFVRRGLHRVMLSEPARQGTAGIHLLGERRSEPRVIELLDLVTRAAAKVLPPL
jgi:LysR family transcriptional regulator of abg operon